MNQLIDNHPFLTFIALMMVAQVLWYPFRIINRWIRHRNIVARGWPPEHLDADGDFKPKPEPEDSDA